MTAKKTKKKKEKEPKPQKEDLEDLRKRASERDEYFDLMLRARADLENFSKRMEKEKIRGKETTIRNFVADMLPALDALHVAVRHPEEADTSSLLDGIRIMEKQLVEVFNSNEIEIIEPTPGEEFDPALHEAVMIEPSDEFEPNHIVESLRRGFTTSGILVRAAQVKVAAQKVEVEEEEKDEE